MMNTVTFLLLVAFTLLNAEVRAQINDSANHGLMLLTTKKNENMNSVQGSPYLDGDFQRGTVMIDGKEPLVVFLRYNVLQEKIEIKTDFSSEDIYILPLSRQTIYYMGKYKIKYEELSHDGKKVNGYFIELFNGDNMRLLEKATVKLSEPVKARTGYEKD